MGFKLITGPTVEPISIAEAKDHLRLDGTDDDEYVSGLIAAARRYVEEYTGRQLMPATWELQLERWVTDVKLPMAAPLSSITSVKYLAEADGTDTTLSTDIYTTDTSDEPAKLILKWNQTWPSARVYPASIRIRYVAGYATAGDVPAGIKHAIKFMVAHLYEMREPINVGNIVNPIPVTLSALINQYRVEYPF